MHLPPPPLPSLFLSSLARLLHLPFPLPFSLPVVHAGTLAAAFGLFYPFSFFLFSSISRAFTRFLSFSFVPPLSQSSPSFGNPPILPRRHFVSFTFSRRSPSLSPFFILSGEFLIIESRRDRERLARAWKILTLFSPEFSQLYLICVPLATPRSFYRTVDFDGFIRTLYSQSLYSRDLKSLIMGATSERASARRTTSARRENYEKRDTGCVAR